MANSSISKSTYSSLYSQPEIGEYIYYTKENTIKALCSKAIAITESNDPILFINLITKLSLFCLSSIPKKHLELIVQCCSKMLQANQSNQRLTHSILIFLSGILSVKGKKLDLSLDWKLYYKLYFIETKDTYEFNINKPEANTNLFTNYYKKIAKHFPHMTQEDYEFIKEESLQHLYHSRIEPGLDVLLYFAPKRFLEQDEQLQEILFKLMKASYISMDKICKLFWIILMKNGQLKINIEEFIKYYFNFLYKYITGKTGVYAYRQNQEKAKAKKNHHQKSDSFIENICASLLFHQQFIPYRLAIDEHFRLLIPIIHLNLKEKYEDRNSNKVIPFMLNLTSAMRYYFYDKELKDEESSLFVFTLRTNNIEIMNRYKVVISYLNPIIHSLFLFDIKYSSVIIERLFNIIADEPFDKDILNKLRFLYDNPEICTQKFIEKLNCVLLNVLNKNNFKGDIASLVIDGISFMIENFSSYNRKINANILYCLSKIYNYCSTIKDNKEYIDNPNYSKLFALMNTKSIVIIKRILPIFEMVTIKLRTFKWFYFSMLSFITEDNQKVLSNEFSSYVIENELDIKYLQHYLIGVSNTKLLWQFCYDSLISIEDEQQQSIQKPKWFLYDINKEIGNKTFEVIIYNEQRLLYFKEILSNLDFRDLDLNEKTQKQFKTIIYVLLYQKDKKYHELAFAIFNSLSKSFLQLNIEKDKIEYPNEIELSYVNELITHFIHPYQSYLINALDTVDNKIGKEKSKKDRKTEGQSYLNQLIEDDYERIVFIYLNYQSVFMNSFNNIFINDNKTMQSNKHIDINNVFKSTIAQYTVINNQISLFNQFNYRLVSFNKYVPCIKNTHILDLLYANIDSQLNQIKPNKSSLEVQSCLSYANRYSNSPSLYSFYEKLLNKQKGFNHINLFKHIADKSNIVNNMKLILLAYDSKMRFSNNEAYCNVLNQPDKDIVILIKEILFGKYIKDLRKIKDNLVSDQNKMDIIIGNSFSLVRLLLLIQPYMHIESTKAIITIMNVLIEKNYSKMNAIYPEIEKVIRVIKENMITKFNHIESKLSAYPQIKSLSIHNNNNSNINSNDYIYYNKKKEKVKESILNQQKESNDSKAFYENQITEYIDQYYTDLYSNNFQANNNTIHMLIMLCNTLVILNRLDINEKDCLEQFEKYSAHILSKVKENNISYEMRKIYFDIYGMIVKYKTKAYKKYIITEYSKEDYAKNQSELTKDAKQSLEINDYPIKYFYKPEYGSIKGSTNDSIEEFNEICNSFYQIKDWSHDKSLMQEQAGIIKMFMSQKQGSGIEQMIQSIISKQTHLTKKRTQFYSVASPSTTSQINKSEVLAFYYYMQYYPKLFSYERLFNYFEHYITNKPQDNKPQSQTDIISLVCLLSMLIGLIRTDINKQNYPNAKQVIAQVLQYYTNGINKQIDNNIIFFMHTIFSKCSIKEMEMIIPLDKPNLSKYPIELYVEIYIIIGYFFTNKLYLYYKSNSEVVSHIKSIITIYQHNHTKLISNQQKFISLVNSYLYGSRLFILNQLDFTIDYNKDCIGFLMSLATFDQELSTINSEILVMFTGILYFNSDLFLQNSDLLMAYMKPFIEYASKEERLLAMITKLDMIFYQSRKPIDIISTIKVLLNNIKMLQGQKRGLMLLSMIRILFQLNLHFNINILNDSELFMSLVSVLDSIDNELKDSFSEFFVIYYEMIKEDNNKRIIDIYREAILNEKREGNAYMKMIIENNISKETIVYFALSQLLRFRTQMPDYIQKLIIDSRKYCNKMNNKGKEAKVIKSLIMKAMDRYHNGYVYLQSQISEECDNALNEMSKNNSYFT